MDEQTAYFTGMMVGFAQKAGLRPEMIRDEDGNYINVFEITNEQGQVSSITVSVETRDGEA